MLVKSKSLKRITRTADELCPREIGRSYDCRVPFDAKLYGLRHRFGTEGARAGLNLSVLGEAMGHSDYRVTATYIHLAGDTELLVNAG